MSGDESSALVRRMVPVRPLDEDPADVSWSHADCWALLYAALRGVTLGTVDREALRTAVESGGGAVLVLVSLIERAREAERAAPETSVEVISSAAGSAGPGGAGSGTGPATTPAYTAPRELWLGSVEPGDEVEVMVFSDEPGIGYERRWVRVTGRVECEGDPDSHDTLTGPLGTVTLTDCEGVVLLDGGSEWHYSRLTRARVRIPCEPPPAPPVMYTPAFGAPAESVEEGWQVEVGGGWHTVTAVADEWPDCDAEASDPCVWLQVDATLPDAAPYPSGPAPVEGRTWVHWHAGDEVTVRIPCEVTA